MNLERRENLKLLRMKLKRNSEQHGKLRKKHLCYKRMKKANPISRLLKKFSKVDRRLEI
jgi:hypothetical protein